MVVASFLSHRTCRPATVLHSYLQCLARQGPPPPCPSILRLLLWPILEPLPHTSQRLPRLRVSSTRRRALTRVSTRTRAQDPALMHLIPPFRFAHSEAGKRARLVPGALHVLGASAHGPSRVFGARLRALRLSRRVCCPMRAASVSAGTPRLEQSNAEPLISRAHFFAPVCVRPPCWIRLLVLYCSVRLVQDVLLPTFLLEMERVQPVPNRPPSGQSIQASSSSLLLLQALRLPCMWLSLWLHFRRVSLGKAL